MTAKKLTEYSPSYPRRRIASGAARLGALAGAVVLTAGAALGCGGGDTKDEPDTTGLMNFETEEAAADPTADPSIVGIVLSAPGDDGK